METNNANNVVHEKVRHNVFLLHLVILLEVSTCTKINVEYNSYIELLCIPISNSILLKEIVSNVSRVSYFMIHGTCT